MVAASVRTFTAAATFKSWLGFRNMHVSECLFKFPAAETPNACSGQSASSDICGGPLACCQCPRTLLLMASEEFCVSS